MQDLSSEHVYQHHLKQVLSPPSRGPRAMPRQCPYPRVLLRVARCFIFGFGVLVRSVTVNDARRCTDSCTLSNWIVSMSIYNIVKYVINIFLLQKVVKARSSKRCRHLCADRCSLVVVMRWPKFFCQATDLDKFKHLMNQKGRQLITHLIFLDVTFVIPLHPQRVLDILVYDKLVKNPTICEISIGLNSNQPMPFHTFERLSNQDVSSVHPVEFKRDSSTVQGIPCCW